MTGRGAGGGATVAEAVGTALVGCGVDTVVGVVGSGNFVVTNAMVAAGARFVAARHEGGAATIADAHARMSGRPTALTLHQGCGLTNALTGIAEAAKSRTPLVVLAAEATSPRSNFAVDQAALATAVGAVLGDPKANRILQPKLKLVRPKVTTAGLAKAYGTIVTIDRGNFKLRLFKGLKLSKTYGVAVGMPAYPTPTGRFTIANKAVNPAWTAPNSPWAGAYANEVVPGGSAENPLKARWLGIVNGVGIHGTGAPGSIGSRASHGCIRMRVPDVIDLYPRVPVGTPVLIGN
jgi:lipoprotein-anchoring transpeptidase ErfK/SrfK